MAPSAASAEDVLAGDVPIPVDAHVLPAPPEASEAAGRFSGAWVGSWSGLTHHVLIVESVDADGAARVVYAVGDNAATGIVRQWQRRQATIWGDTLTIAGVFTTTYTLRPPDRLTANFRLGSGVSEATLSRIDLADLTRPGAGIAWTNPTEFLNTGLEEDGRPVRLEVVIDKPAGDGPFPLVVFNHGSTGNGRQPGIFGMTSWSPNVAHFFVKKGWMVAFPQRRGRGRSDGLYDEGFEPDRAKGYTCDPARSLAGADRALGDIEAAVTALRERPDVSSDRIVVGGISRGGILSMVYAGVHPEQVRGVVNFVGGWVGEGCRSSGDINGALFRRGAKFADSTLWLYGRHDTFYSIGHSRSNFDAFTRAGGRGDFMEFDVPTGNGHGLSAHPDLWTGPVEKYLTAITETAGVR
jgi:dienelactone hydrolase